MDHFSCRMGHSFEIPFTPEAQEHLFFYEVSCYRKSKRIRNFMLDSAQLSEAYPKWRELQAFEPSKGALWRTISVASPVRPQTCLTCEVHYVTN